MVTDLFSNHVLLSAASAWLTAQIVKTVVAFVQGKGLQPRYLFTSGGMPSAHSAFVTALTTGVALQAGTASVAFAISAALALVVMYDATDVRHSVGRQSIVINRIVEEIRLGRPMTELKSDLREFVGHTPFQVFAGAALGIAVAWVWLTVAGV
jgi:acid phosphatase family membrane protein YuiD